MHTLSRRTISARALRPLGVMSWCDAVTERRLFAVLLFSLGSVTVSTNVGEAQLTDVTQAPNAMHAGIQKSLAQEIDAGAGDSCTVGSSIFNIQRDPARAIRRGRQLFQRKFTQEQGLGPRANDGIGDIGANGAIGAGLVDSCAGCHARPRGSAGAGGDVATRPDSRDAPHLFGLGLKEQLADEITKRLRRIRRLAIADAKEVGYPVTRSLNAQGIDYGAITALPDGTVDTSGVEGVNADLRVRPFFAHGGTISIREFVVGALNNEMGLQAVDPCLAAAASKGRCVTPSGMVLDGAKDATEAPRVTDELDDGDGDGVANEIPTALVDYLEFYLLNYFSPGLYRRTAESVRGLAEFNAIGCANCHVQDLTIAHDRRVADVETVYDPTRGIFNRLFSTVDARFVQRDDGSGFPSLKLPERGRFVVHNIFTDFKRHDLGPNFHERNYDGSMQTEFMTAALWGVGSTSPYGHDGRSINLKEVIVRHGGEALPSRNAFVKLAPEDKAAIVAFLETLVLFPPDDTASDLDPGNRAAPDFPQNGHGSIKLGVLFNDPSDLE
jgi:hypothetical protein